MNPLLDQVAKDLIDLGVGVIRGPESVPGVISEFPGKDGEINFKDVDVVVVSSRWRLSMSVLENSNRLRGIVAPTIGVEAIDVDRATQLGLLVGHGAFSNNYESMAEADLAREKRIPY